MYKIIPLIGIMMIGTSGSLLAEPNSSDSATTLDSTIELLDPESVLENDPSFNPIDLDQYKADAGVTFQIRKKGSGEEAVQYQYPYFNEAWLNQEVGDIEKWYDEKSAEIDALKEHDIASAHYHFQIDVIHQTPTFLVLKFDRSEYTGGAHGTEIVTYKNIDLLNQRLVHLSDFFPTMEERDDFIAMAEIYFRDQNGIQLDDDYADFGYRFNNGFVLSKEYAFLEEGLLFHYNNYEIAPYAMGQTELTIPYFYLHLVDPEGNNPIFDFVRNQVKGYIGMGMRE